MGKGNIEIDYDEIEDILYISKSSEKSKFSIDISTPQGDIVIDFDHKGLVTGIEMFNASKHFPLVDNKKIEKVDFNINYGHKWLSIQLLFYIPGINQPLITNIYSPYNKEVIINA